MRGLRDEREWVTVFIYRGHCVRTLNITRAGEIRGYRIDDRPEIYTTAGEAVSEIVRLLAAAGGENND